MDVFEDSAKNRINNLPEPKIELKSSISMQLRILLLNKKIAIIAIAAVLMLCFGLIFIIFSPKSEINSNEQSQIIRPTKLPRQQDVTMKENAAIQKQKNIDKVFADKERRIKAEYPWIYNLPLQSDKYFVYFDLQNKVFIGLLYPKTGNNVEQLKTIVMQELKLAKKIPVENFKFEWTINPKN